MDIVVRDIDNIILLNRFDAFKSISSNGYSFYTTDFVLTAYCLDGELPEIFNSGNVKIRTFTPSETLSVNLFYKKYKSSLSIADCSVIFFASVSGSTLITNQQILAEKAKENNVTVECFAWIQNLLLLKKTA